MSDVKVTIEGKDTSYPSASFDVIDFSDAMRDQAEAAFDLETNEWSTHPIAQLEALGRHLVAELDLSDEDIILGVLDNVLENSTDTDELVTALHGYCDSIINLHFPGMPLSGELLSASTSNNTYNHESSLAGAINYTVIPLTDLSDCYDPCLIVWECNTGGDPRGGYGPGTAGFFPGGIASCQLISPCIDAIILDQDGNAYDTDCGVGYHGSCSFQQLIDNNIDGYTVLLEDDCPVWENDDLVLIGRNGERCLASFYSECVGC